MSPPKAAIHGPKARLIMAQELHYPLETKDNLENTFLIHPAYADDTTFGGVNDNRNNTFLKLLQRKKTKLMQLDMFSISIGSNRKKAWFVPQKWALRRPLRLKNMF